MAFTSSVSPSLLSVYSPSPFRPSLSSSSDSFLLSERRGEGGEGEEVLLFLFVLFGVFGECLWKRGTPGVKKEAGLFLARRRAFLRAPGDAFGERPRSSMGEALRGVSVRSGACVLAAFASPSPCC